MDAQIYGFAGGIRATKSTLIHYGMRWYDPTTGRFTQQDSLETLADPSRANRYEYAASNPTNYVDPTGLFPGGAVGAAVGTIVGGAIAGYTCAVSVLIGCAAVAVVAGGGLPAAGTLIGSALSGDTPGVTDVIGTVAGALGAVASGVAGFFAGN